MGDRLTILHGDCREVLRTLADASVQCCVTSPPYWGLRDYGTATWEGGEEGCDHKHQLGGEGDKSAKQNTSAGTQTLAYRDVCAKCGARRIDSQLGLERTPEEYVARMVEVFREVRRVLRDDGTLWLNLGDSYAANGAGSWGSSDKSTLTTGSKNGAWAPGKTIGTTPPRNGHGLKPKDLVGIPWRVAFALQEDRWYLRSDIVWAKPNPMPESVTDRPTKSHEYVFLLSKRANYYYDAEAVAEPAEYRDDARPFGQAGLNRHGDEGMIYDPTKSRKRGDYNGKTNDLEGREAFKAYTMTRNKRTVWTVATAPFKEAHFATFPPDLIRPCVRAGCPVGGVVIDPFGGSGTTGMVALEEGRRAVLIELNPAYAEMARQRCNVTPGLALA